MGLGTSAKASEVDDSDEEDDEPDAKGTSAPPKPSFETVPAVAQSKEDADEHVGEFGSAKSAASHATESQQGGKASLEQRRAALLRCIRRAEDSEATYEMMHCFIVRDRSGTNYMSPVYRLYKEPPAGEDRSRAQFIASGRKRVLKGGSNFLISLEGTPTDRTSDGLVGKLRGDWSGSAYTIYDDGLNPEKTQNTRLIRRELGYVKFEQGAVGPGALRVVLPCVSPAGAMDVWQPQDPRDTIGSIVGNGMKTLRGDGVKPPLLTLENKVPKRDDATGQMVLDFKGRVTQSSVKNFQLRCEAISGDMTVLQFGRIDKNVFTMDFAHPLCLVQAFAVCLSVFDGKSPDFTPDVDAMLGGGAKGDAKAQERDSEAMYNPQGGRRVTGSMTGSRGIMGNLSERMPSRQYLSDKLRRS